MRCNDRVMPPSLTDLERATRLIAGTYDGPHCVEAAALAVEVGARLGYELNARPVSMFAFNSVTGASTATGVQGRAFGEQYLRQFGSFAIGGEFEGGSPFQRQAGHMIVVSEKHALLLDPTFAQFKVLGDAAVGLYVTEARARANGRFWQVEDDDFFVRYFAADDYMEESFDDARTASTMRADEIAAYVRL
jgi:hypothetical protein